MFVTSGSVMAPSHRRVVAGALFFLGAVLAAPFLALFDDPFPGAHQLYLGWPMAGTLSGGALAVAAVFLATRKTSLPPPTSLRHRADHAGESSI